MQDLLDTETAMREEKDTNLETKITNNENTLATLNGSGDGSVSKTVSEKIAEIVIEESQTKKISKATAGEISDTSQIKKVLAPTGKTTYIHVCDFGGEDIENGILELYVGANGNTIIDSFKITTSISSTKAISDDIKYRHALDVFYTKHTAVWGIKGIYISASAYNSTQSLWLKVIIRDTEGSNGGAGCTYYFTKNSYLADITWILETSETAPSDITTSFEPSAAFGHQTA